MAKKKQFDDVAIFMEYSIDLSTRTIYMGSSSDLNEESEGITGRLSERVIKAIHILDSQPGEQELTIIINNPGGDVYEGLAIYDAIKSCKNRVRAVVYGRCMSMASWILQAADERIMAASSVMMIHYGECHISGHSKSAMIWAKEEERLNKVMEEILLEKMKEKIPEVTRTQLHNMIKFDKILTAAEAVELGLADSIL